MNNKAKKFIRNEVALAIACLHISAQQANHSERLEWRVRHYDHLRTAKRAAKMLR